MKKISKILAVVLALALTLGVLALNIGASSDIKNQLAINDDAAGIHVSTYNGGVNASDFEDEKILIEYGRDDILRIVESKSGNHYVSLHRDANGDTVTSSGKTDPYWHIMGNFASDKQADAKGIFFNDYVVLDFDFGTDSFVLTKEFLFGADFADIERSTADNYAIYKEGNSKGIEAGKYYLINEVPVKYDERVILGTDVTADIDGYAIWTEGNAAGEVAGAFVTSYAGDKILYETLKPAMADWMVNFMYSVYRTKSNRISTNGTFKYIEESNDWAFVVNGVTFPLNVKVGEWKHMTVIAAVDNTVTYVDHLGNKTVAPFNQEIITAIDTPVLEGGGHATYASYELGIANTTNYFFIDGEFVTKTTPFASYGANADIDTRGWRYTEGADFYGLRIMRTKAEVDYVDMQFSLCFDNITTNYYKDGYEGDLKEYLNDDPENKPLYMCDDVVIGKNYDAPEKGVVAYTYDNVDVDNATELQFENAWTAVNSAFENKTFAVIRESVYNYTIPYTKSSPDQFYVKCENGAEFTLGVGTGYTMSEEPDANGYYVMKRAQQVEIIWFATEGSYENEEPDYMNIVLAGSYLEYDGEISEDVYLGEGKFHGFIGWEYCYNLSGEFIPFEGDPILTVEMYEKVRELQETAGEGFITIRGVYGKTKEAYFSTKVGNAEPTFYFTEDEANNSGAIITALKGSYTVQLYKDITPDLGNVDGYYITVAQGETFSLDLNGCTYALINSYSGGKFIRPYKNCTINIYSSKEGGLMTTRGRLILTASTNALDNVTVNLGKFGDIPGDNLTIGCSTISYTAAETNFSNTLNINGGYYYCTGAFWTCRGSWNINVENATMRTAGTAGTFATATSKVAASWIKLNVKDSVILCRDSKGKATPLFNDFNANCSATFDGCTIQASMTATTLETVKGTVVFTNGTKISTPDNLITQLITDSNTVFLGSNAAETHLHKSVTVNAGTCTDMQAELTFTYVAVPKTSVPTISGLMANISTGNGFFVNFYVPTASGYTITGAESLGNTVIGGVEYAIYKASCISPATVEDVTVQVNFKLFNAICYKEISVSLYDYFKGVLDNANSTDAEKALVVNAANYCNTVYKYVNKEDYASYKAIVDASSLVIAPSDLANVKNVLSTDVISGAQLAVSTGNVPTFAFTKAGEATVTVKYTDIYGNEQTVTCEVNTINNVEYYTVSHMAAYDMIGTINVYADGELVLTYSLGDYITETSDEIAIALYGYAKAVSNYKKN